MAWLTWVPCYCLEVVHAYRSSPAASVSYHAYIKYMVYYVCTSYQCMQCNCNPINIVDIICIEKKIDSPHSHLVFLTK